MGVNIGEKPRKHKEHYFLVFLVLLFKYGISYNSAPSGLIGTRIGGHVATGLPDLSKPSRDQINLRKTKFFRINIFETKRTNYFGHFSSGFWDSRHFQWCIYTVFDEE